jgi:hypothetical protein
MGQRLPGLLATESRGCGLSPRNLPDRAEGKKAEAAGDVCGGHGKNPRVQGPDMPTAVQATDREEEMAGNGPWPVIDPACRINGIVRDSV